MTSSYNHKKCITRIVHIDPQNHFYDSHRASNFRETFCLFLLQVAMIDPRSHGTKVIDTHSNSFNSCITLHRFVELKKVLLESGLAEFHMTRGGQNPTQ